MSCWMIHNDHARYLVNVAEEHAPDLLSQYGGRQQVGQDLLDTCAASVSARYTDCTQASEVYRDGAESVPIELGQAIKSLDCYEYQACEVKNWEAEPMCRFCDSLRRSLMRCVPGYDSAEWGHPNSHSAAPDLLEALQTAHSLICRVIAGERPYQWMGEGEEIRATIAAAIAKAEGGAK